MIRRYQQLQRGSWCLTAGAHSLCSEEKAKRNVVHVRASSLSDSHETASFPDNTVLFPWQGLPTRQTFPAIIRYALLLTGIAVRLNDLVFCTLEDSWLEQLYYGGQTEIDGLSSAKWSRLCMLVIRSLVSYSPLVVILHEGQDPEHPTAKAEELVVLLGTHCSPLAFSLVAQTLIHSWGFPHLVGHPWVILH